MSLSLDDNHAKYQIRGYQPGIIQINEQTFTRSLIVGPDKLIIDWQPQHISELTYEHLAIILTWHPTILLIGTGRTLEFPALDVYGNLLNQNIGVEIMHTGAACHTYNALTAENRNVIAALIIN